jgi:membrane fusion protein (multidrug efflux system)
MTKINFSTMYMKSSFPLLIAIAACGPIVVSTGGCTTKKPPASVATDKTTTHYQLATVERSGLAQLVKLPAQLASFQQVSIFPKVNGYVKEVLVDIGTHVKKGQLLMTLEAPELEQAAMQAKERYARAKLDYTISAENYERMRLASETPGAVSPMGLAALKAKAEADSALCNAEKANWQMQQAILAYLRVTAPFDGTISERNVHPGALVSAEGKDNKPMLELRQVDHLRLQVDIPEGIAANLSDKDTVSFYLSAFPGKKMTGEVSRMSGFVNSQFRSERMELDVYNRNGKLAPGMYGDVLLDSKGNPDAFSVPKSAVITSTERKYVLAIQGGKATKVDVTTGNESADKIEVIGALRPGDQVIVNGSDEMKDGVSIN